MARGNLIQGQGSGKVGDVVFMVRQGQQVSRVYTESGARSGKEASEAARIQRVKFGSGSNQWNLYRYVCTRMYRRGRLGRQSDYNYFVKKNAALLPYLGKGENASGVRVLQPGIMSEGSLGRIELVHSYNPTWTETTNIIVVSDSTISIAETIGWAATMGSLKAALALAYPNARKVSYLFSVADEIEIEEGGLSYASQNVNHSAVSIDLYKESTPGENTTTIKEYFSARVKSQKLAGIINGQALTMCVGSNILYFRTANQEDATFLGKVGVLFFATDDNVGDCYTTILPADGVNPSAGCYADWAGYRTNSSLRIACDSYGYQSGVMRDEIASLGNEINVLAQGYAARLASIDAEAHGAFLKSIGDVSQVQAKAVRKATEEK